MYFILDKDMILNNLPSTDSEQGFWPYGSLAGDCQRDPI